MNNISPQCPVAASKSNAMAAAELACQARGVQFTPIRKLVLRILWDAAQPLGAYMVLKRIEKHLNRHIAPPTVYRALDFLVEQRLIARLESRHAYVPCANVGPHHASAYFICEKCGVSEEIEDTDIQRTLESKADTLGFYIKRSVMELQGLCASCSSTVTSTIAPNSRTSNVSRPNSR